MRKKLNLKILCILFVLELVSLVFSACNDTSAEIIFMDGNIAYTTVKSSGNEIIEMPFDPKKEGFKFRGWFYDNIEWIQPFSAYSLWNTPLLDDIKVYAKWEYIPPAPMSKRVETPDGLILSLSDDKAYFTVMLYNEKYSEISIPESYENIPITAIGAYAFRACYNLTSVTIPSSITSIGKSAFEYCSLLSHIEIPNSITTIEESAFSNCGFKSIVIPDSVTRIENSAFSYNDYLESVVIPDGITDIAEQMFHGCNKLVSIEIPDSVTNISRYAFDNTAWLDNQPDGVVYVGKVAYCYKGTMPENTSIEFQEGTKGIADYYETGNSIYSNLICVTIPDSVINIGERAFSALGNLSSVVISNNSNLKIIGDCAFDYCLNLTSINLPEGLTTIGYLAFNHCKLASINIPSSVTSIGDGTFNFCPLTSITLSEENASYELIDGVLFNADLTKLIKCPNRDSVKSYSIPDSVTKICPNAFEGCSSLTEIYIPDSITDITDYAFYGCDGLTSITLPDSITGIADSAYKNCSGLTSITVPDSVTFLGNSAFSYCDNLANVTIPNFVTKLGDGLFIGCAKLNSITIPKSVTNMGYNIFGACMSLEEILVDAENQSYTSLDGIMYNKDETQIISVPQGKIGEVTLPNGISEISNRAFFDCGEITSIKIPSSVAAIDAQAFDSCPALLEIVVDEENQNYTSQNGILYNKNKTQIIDVPRAISGEIILPGGVTTVPDYAFSYCKNITKVVIPDGVKTIGRGAFYGCEALASIILPSSITSIGERAFYYCYKLVSVTIPKNLSIGESAFRYLPAFENVYYYGENETEWNQISFGDNNSILKNATRYYYSETEILDIAHWRFVDGVPTVWA